MNTARYFAKIISIVRQYGVRSILVHTLLVWALIQAQDDSPELAVATLALAKTHP